jgi:hypothetical protein
MTALELIVRPFQSKDVTPPKRIIEAEKQVDPVDVSIGSEGGTALLFRAFSVIEFKTEDSYTYREIDRKTHTKRVENPDDPSQYVEVERIDQISLRHKLNPDDKRIYEIKNND